MEEQVNPEQENVIAAAEAAAEAVSEEVQADAAAPAVEEEKAERRERVQKEVTQDMLDRTSQDLMKMLDFLGHDDATVKPSAVNGDICLDIRSEDAGRIIGRKGQSLESLQLLINRMCQKDDPDYPRIMLSIDGYSSRTPGGRNSRRDDDDNGRRRGGKGDRNGRRRGNDRDGGNDEIIRQQALDAAKEVRLWGEPKTLPAMNAHDRRIVHITLKNEADIMTESEGEGAKKTIVISMKK
jgi:spoIIIJ-associated protein